MTTQSKDYAREYRERNREKIRAYKAEWREANREKIRNYDRANKYARGRVEALRDRNRKWVWEYKLSHPCAGTTEGPCPYGVTDPRVLEFDHIGDDKEANVSTLVAGPASLARLQAEVARCVVRCCNCHTIVTFERAGNYTTRMIAK